ncbi:MAG: hypothetical protein H7268_01615 [Sandarakinorhabdus sp.]|nr:hypothetical protein [Sandarakinorhabdus sp.]
MTLLLTVFTMIAFAGVYAVLLAMVGARFDALFEALFGRRVQVGGNAAFAASRRFNRA